jgi:hypothetical protein
MIDFASGVGHPPLGSNAADPWIVVAIPSGHGTDRGAVGIIGALLVYQPVWQRLIEALSCHAHLRLHNVI